MGLFDGLKQQLGFGVPTQYAQGYGSVQSRPALDLNIGGFAPSDADSADYTSGGLGNALEFNSGAAKRYAEPEEVTPIPAQEEARKPVGLAELSGLKSQPESFEEPAQRSGIATGDARDRLLRMAGIPTDAERSKAQSDQRMAQQVAKIAGVSYANPEQEGISSLDQARRYQDIANDPRTKGTPEGNFARQQYDKIMKSSGGVLQQAAKDEAGAAAAEAAGRQQAFQNQLETEKLGLQKASNAREEALLSGKVKAQELENMQKQFDVETNPLKKEQLGQNIEKTKKEIGEIGAKTQIARENQSLEKQKFEFTKEKDREGGAVDTIKTFQNAVSEGIKQAQAEYEKDINKLTSGLSSKNPNQVRAEHADARQKVINNAIGSAVQIGRRRGMSDDEIKQMVSVSLPQLKGVTPSELQRAIGAFKELSGPVTNIVSAVKGGTNIAAGGG